MSQSKPTLLVDFCDYQAAKFAVMNWHYSKSLPIASHLVKVGCWEDGKFIGVVLYSWGANKLIGSPYGLKQVEVCELVRVALGKHLLPTSMIVSASRRLIVRQNPGLRLIVSYADTKQGHTGTIYQAMNWYYVGLVKGTFLYYLNGKMVHARQAASRLGSVAGLKAIYSGDKHKYLLPLDKAMRKQILPLSQPYPKRKDETKPELEASEKSD